GRLASRIDEAGKIAGRLCERDKPAGLIGNLGQVAAGIGESESPAHSVGGLRRTVGSRCDGDLVSVAILNANQFASGIEGIDEVVVDRVIPVFAANLDELVEIALLVYEL